MHKHITVYSPSWPVLTCHLCLFEPSLTHVQSVATLDPKSALSRGIAALLLQVGLQPETVAFDVKFNILLLQ